MYITYSIIPVWKIDGFENQSRINITKTEKNRSTFNKNGALIQTFLVINPLEKIDESTTFYCYMELIR